MAKRAGRACTIRTGVLVGVLAWCASASAAGRAPAKTAPWEPLPIYGGGSVQNVLFTSDPDILYSYVDVCGPYRSDDGGKTWRPLHGHLTMPLRMRQFGEPRAMSVDPRDPDNIIVCAGGNPRCTGGMMVSRDGGQTFRQTGVARYYGNGRRRRLGFLLSRNPRNPDELIAGSDHTGIFRTCDNGETWQSVPGTDRYWFSDIRYDTVVPGRVWACAPGWEDVPQDAHVRAKGTYPVWLPEPGRARGFFRSDDGGLTWTKLDIGRIPTEIVQIPRTKSIIGIFDLRQIKRSDDGGATWIDYHQGLPALKPDVKVWDNWGCQRGHYQTLAAGGDFVLAADTRGHCFSRRNGDAAWKEHVRTHVTAGDPVREPRCRRLDHMPHTSALTVDPRDPKHWMMTDWYCVWETRDAGATWITRNTGMTQLVSFQVAASPFDTNRIFYAAADSNLFLSRDGGRTYEEAAGIKNSVNKIAFSRVTPGLALVTGGKFDVDILRTRDDGETWERPKLAGLPPLKGDLSYADHDKHGAFTVVCHPAKDEFYLTVGGWIGKGQGGVYRSRDAGDTWTWMPGLPEKGLMFQNCEWGVSFAQVAVSEDGSAMCFSQDGRQVYRLAPGGETWIKTDFDMQVKDADFLQVVRPQLLAVPGRPGWFLAKSGAQSAYLHLSRNGGRTFEKIDQPSGLFVSCAFDWADPGTLIVTGRDQVYLSRDYGAHFTVLPGGRDIPTGAGGAITVDRGRMWAICSGTGVWTRRIDAPPASAPQAWPVLTAADKARMAAIVAPTVVAVPPYMVYRSFCVLPDGRLRHYGRTMVGKRATRCYIESDNLGLDWRLVTHVSEADVGAMARCPWAPYYLTVYDDRTAPRTPDGRRPLCAYRSVIGPGDCHPEIFPFEPSVRMGFYEQPHPLPTWRRWALGGASSWQKDGYHPRVALSKDDGRTWTIQELKSVDASAIVPPDQMRRWNNGCCEPSIVEMQDGRVWMIVRATPDNHYLYVSADGGETWDGPSKMPAFYASNTWPNIMRLRDGRLLFFWNNTWPYPKGKVTDYSELWPGSWEDLGRGESVFTNRDAIHAAISEDDGKTWIGFREVLLNEIRNDADFRQQGNGPIDEIDKSVHQSQAFELPNGKVIVAIGQNPAARRIVIFDPKWLYETSRTEDFRHGLGGVTTHLYVRSLSGGYRKWAGHCAWNRVAGALLVPEPDKTGRAAVREVLQLCRNPDKRLVSDRQGVVWNFPAARKGTVTLTCRIDGSGFRLALCDRWFNASDEQVAGKSPAVFEVTEKTLGGFRTWADVDVAWDADARTVTLSCGTHREVKPFSLDGFSPAGLSYLHLQTLAEGEDTKGTYFKAFGKK